MSTIDVMNYNVGDEAGHPSPRRRLVAAGQAVLRPTGEPAPVGRRARALTRAMSRAALDRAGPPPSHGAAGRDPRLRQVERHGAGGPPRIPGPRTAPRVGRRPAGEGTRPHPDRLPAPRPSPRPDDRAARRPRTPVPPRAAGAGPDPLAPARVTKPPRAPSVSRPRSARGPSARWRPPPARRRGPGASGCTAHAPGGPAARREPPA